MNQMVGVTHDRISEPYTHLWNAHSLNPPQVRRVLCSHLTEPGTLPSFKQNRSDRRQCTVLGIALIVPCSKLGISIPDLHTVFWNSSTLNKVGL